MSMYDLEEDRLVAEITGRGARRLLIQLPDGLKNEGPRLASLVRERTGADVFVSASSAWGACDLSLDAAARLKADLLVHYGQRISARRVQRHTCRLYSRQEQTRDNPSRG